jgi:flavin reductase (DIM6/NTAB) family NADH-FMN oxidoreductase RutF
MDAAARKTALRLIPYGLYVLTVDGESVAAGTINWVSQMSFEPPLLALGVKQDTKSLANLSAGGRAALSFLGTGQGELAFAFFGDSPVEGSEFVTKNRRVPFERTPAGGIVLTEAPAWADLQLRETITIGDHAVAVVEVTDVGLRADAPEALTLKELGLNYGG